MCRVAPCATDRCSAFLCASLAKCVSADEAEEDSDEDSDEDDDWDDDDDDFDYDSGTEEGAAALDDSVCPPGR